MTQIDFFHPAFSGWQVSNTPVPQDMIDRIPQLTWTDVQVRTQPLSFYPGAELLVMRSPTWAPSNLCIYALKRDDTVCLLNGTSPELHAFNAQSKPELNEKSALEYLRFFCFFVRGEDGPFYIVDSMTSVYLPEGIRQGTASEGLESAGQRLKERYQSPRSHGRGGDGAWRFSATVFYSNAFFVADFEVEDGGMIKMRDDTSLLTDLPFRIWAPIMPEADAKATLN